MEKENKQRWFIKKRFGIWAIAIIAFLCGIAMYLSSDVQRLQRQLELGQKYLTELDYEQAAIAFEKAMAIEAKNVEAYIGLSKAYEGMDAYEETINLLTTAYEVTEAEEIKILLAQKREEKREKEQSVRKEIEAKQKETEQSEKEKDKKTTESDNQLQTLENGAVRVNFERFYEGLYECAIITGIDSRGDTIWTYQTKYMAADLDCVSEIGVRDDCYYFVEDGSVIAMNLSDGTVKWKNDSFVGSGTAFAFGDDGSLYICGYYGPDFFAVDKDGNTINRIENFDSNYFWSYKMEYLVDQVRVTLEGSDDWQDDQTVFCVNLDDFTYYKETSEIEADEVSETFDFVVKIFNTDSFPYQSRLLVTGHDGVVIGEVIYSGQDKYTNYYGSVETGDLTNDGKEEILVNMAYFGSTYGATDIYVYTVEANELIEMLSLGTEEVHEIYPEIRFGTGALIENGCLKINGLMDGDSWKKEYIDIRIKYQGGQWIRVD